MASLVKHVRYTGLALAIAFGLMVLSSVTSPLLSDELAGLFPGTTVVFADEPADGSG